MKTYIAQTQTGMVTIMANNKSEAFHQLTNRGYDLNKNWVDVSRCHFDYSPFKKVGYVIAWEDRGIRYLGLDQSEIGTNDIESAMTFGTRDAAESYMKYHCGDHCYISNN